MLSNTLIKYERIRTLVNELSQSEEFKGLAISIVCLDKGLIHSNIQTRIDPANTKAALQMLIKDIDSKQYGFDKNTPIVN